MRELLILKKSKGGESMDRRQISTEKGKFRTREGGDEEDIEEDWKIKIEIEGIQILYIGRVRWQWMAPLALI